MIYNICCISLAPSLLWLSIIAAGQAAAAVGVKQLRVAVTLRMLEIMTLVTIVMMERGRRPLMDLSSWAPPPGWGRQLLRQGVGWEEQGCMLPPTTNCSTAGRIAPLPSFHWHCRETWGTLRSGHSAGGFSSTCCPQTALGGQELLQL